MPDVPSCSRLAALGPAPLTASVELNRFAEKDLSEAFCMDKGPHPWKVAGVKRLLALAKPSWGSCSTLVHSHLYTFPHIYGVGSRLSSTAVYPPCPPTICENLDGCPSGHG